MTLYRVQVTEGARTDTIPGVRTTTLPGVGADGKVYLLAYSRGGLIDNAYTYDPNTRTLTIVEFPAEVSPYAFHHAISPDARHIAYISTDSVGAFGVVRSWPAGVLIARTPSEPWFTGDIDYNGARWLDANHAELIYRSGVDRSRDLWVHTIVTVDPRSVKVDSLTSQPEWKR